MFVLSISSFNPVSFAVEAPLNQSWVDENLALMSYAWRQTRQITTTVMRVEPTRTTRSFFNALLGCQLRGVMESLAHDDSARRASGGGERIAVGKFVAEIRAARAERDVADGARGGATGEQAGDEGERGAVWMRW